MGVVAVSSRSMNEVYKSAWERLAIDRERCADIDPECTPVLAFGDWQTARIVTAGLNPSEDEFWTKPIRKVGRQPLRNGQQRFLHWGNGVLDDTRLQEAFRRMRGYFRLGNAYSLWFDRYKNFLEALGAPFESGMACHTDYVSPFATRVGLSKCAANTSRLLQDFGESIWIDVLDRCPNIECVFGHGRGWRRVPRILARHSDWKHVPTEFDRKGGKSAGQHLWRSNAVLPSGRSIQVWWWRPNRDGMPFCFLSGKECGRLGSTVMKLLRA